MANLLVCLLLVDLVAKDALGSPEFGDDVSLAAGEVLERVRGQQEQGEEAAGEQEGAERDRPPRDGRRADCELLGDEAGVRGGGAEPAPQRIQQTQYVLFKKLKSSSLY